MANNYPSSRIIKATSQQWPGTGTLVSTPFSGETWRCRVISQVAGWIAIDNLGTVPTTAGGNGTFLPASTAGGEVFSCSPSQTLSFSSSTTSSGAWVNVAELS
jgi:hypothetical protein